MNIADPTGLAGELINATVPGAYYQSIATQQFQSGNYGTAALYEIAALGEAALALYPVGAINRISAGLKPPTIFPSSVYDTSVTAVGSKFTNIKTYITPSEFQSNLISNGYRVTGNKSGTTLLTNGSSTYAIYGRDSLSGGLGAHYVGPNGNALKFVFGSP